MKGFVLAFLLLCSPVFAGEPVTVFVSVDSKPVKVQSASYNKYLVDMFSYGGIGVKWQSSDGKRIRNVFVVRTDNLSIDYSEKCPSFTLKSDDEKSSCKVRLLAVKQTDVGTVWIWVPESDKALGFDFVDLRGEAEEVLQSVHSPLKASTIASIIKAADEQIVSQKSK